MVSSAVKASEILPLQQSWLVDWPVGLARGPPASFLADT